MKRIQTKNNFFKVKKLINPISKCKGSLSFISKLKFDQILNRKKKKKILTNQ